MKNKVTFVTFVFLLLISIGCTGINYAVFTPPNTSPTPNYSTPYDIYTMGGLVYHKNTVPGGLGENAQASKKGKACAKSFLWLVAVGDSSIEKAKANGKITKVHTVEYEQFAILGSVYHRFCTIIQGN
ncbi:MAG: TRL-like family protein [Spirochaetota bacterium]